MISKFFKIVKTHGFLKGISYILDKITGRYALKESVDTLYYFLNQSINIKSFPKAEGDLRKLQKCDAELLKIFHLACQKFNLKYWLDYGTLLGAVRHGGFIPWDDDLDVAMPREDYNRALKLLPDEMSKHGIDVGEFSFKPLASFGFSLNHKQTGIWLDVFPVDECYCSNELDIIKNDLAKNINAYKTYYRRNKLKKSCDQLLSVKNRLISSIYCKSDVQTHKILYHCPEFLEPKQILHNDFEIFPLKKIRFEDYEFYAPNDIHSYLCREYGNNYMSFPKSGVEQHNGEQGKLKDWAKANNIDMDCTLNQLNDIVSLYSENV